MVEVKICGNRSREDLETTAGADAVGFVVSTPESPRNVTPEKAARLVEETPLFTETVLVTTETVPARLGRLAAKVGPDYLQLHSELSGGELEEISGYVPEELGLLALISVVGDEEELLTRAGDLAESAADALLLDSKSDGRAGGTGRTHDWELSRRLREAVSPFPVILAGGLRPDNVRRAIETVEPSAVDAASGLEVAGRKSSNKVNKFIEEVKQSGA